jgi:hypothetical protein
MTAAVIPQTRWRIPPEFASSYEPDETGQHVRSIERVVIRRNGSPYSVRERLLKPTFHKWTGLRYVRLATGQRGRYFTLYELRPSPVGRPPKGKIA